MSVVTERGQTSIPAQLRRALKLTRGRKLLWERLSDHELRVRTVDDAAPPGALAVLGFARRFRKQARTTQGWMAELRGGEASESKRSGRQKPPPRPPKEK